jgi:polyhydroxybutyrate depolymerase
MDMRVGGVRCTALAVVGLATLAAVLLAACGAPAPRTASPKVPVMSVNRTVTVASASGNRTAIVHRPAGLAPNSPLVVVMHGAGGTAEQVRTSFGWDNLADRDGFEVAYPNGLGRYWNAGKCCGPPHARHVDDLGFLHGLVQRLAAQDGVDPRRVYAVGMSNGAMMAYAWACALPDDLAGIGPVAGALVAPCTPAPAITVVAVHGTGDRSVPINGGVGPRSVSHYDYPALAVSLAPFVAADRCGTLPKRTERPMVQISTWTCASDRNITVAVVNGLGHEWPGARPTDALKRLMRQPVALDATTFLWSHLRTSTDS